MSSRFRIVELYTCDGAELNLILMKSYNALNFCNSEVPLNWARVLELIRMVSKILIDLLTMIFNSPLVCFSILIVEERINKLTITEINSHAVF